MEPLRQAALCLTAQPLLAEGYRPSREPHSVAFAPGSDAVRLRLGADLGRVDLFVGIRYRLVEPSPAGSRGWGIETIGYLYMILDREGREILAYHWHPFARGPGFPHLHRSGRIGVLPIGGQAPPVALGGMHLPTEEITFPAIVRLLLGEFGAAPRRQDWEGGRCPERRRLPGAADRSPVARGATPAGLVGRRPRYLVARKQPATWSSTMPTLCMKA